jgi:hypothetical protein
MQVTEMNAMRQVARVLATVVALGCGAGVSAHHSAAQFDFGKSVQVTGVVKKFQAINPHMRLVLTVTDAKGTRDIDFEGHSTNNMYRGCYRDKMINLGDKITVTIAPLKDGGEGGYVTGAVTAKGEKFGLGAGGECERVKGAL